VTLTTIGDIGQANLTEQTNAAVTWETASDWDAATVQENTAHAAYGDLPGAATVQMGWPENDLGGSSLLMFHPLHDATGTSAIEDASGSGNDGSTINDDSGLGATGLYNSTSWDFDGSNDYYQVPYNSWDLGGDWTLHFMLDGNFAPNTSWSPFIGNRPSTDINTWVGSDQLWDLRGGVSDYRDVGTYEDGNWHVFTVKRESGTHYTYVDGADKVNHGGSSTTDDGSPYRVGEDRNGNYGSGRLANHRLYTRAQTDTEIARLADDLTSGVLETATKSMQSSKPNLENLSYSLNGQDITVKAIGSPGSGSEEIVSQTLDGATSYSLSWSSTHTDFRVRLEFSTTDVTTSPTLSAVTLT